MVRWGLRGWSKSDAVSWGRFATWDADNNRLISRSEFLAQWDQLTVYDEWAVDDDPELGEEEFARGVYATWDSNGDGVVDMIEYRF